MAHVDIDDAVVEALYEYGCTGFESVRSEEHTSELQSH